MAAAVCWLVVVALEAALVCGAVRADSVGQAEWTGLVESMEGGPHQWRK